LPPTVLLLFKKINPVTPHSSFDFEFSDPVHLIAAASASGLDGLLRELDSDKVKDREHLTVQYTTTGGKGPAGNWLSAWEHLSRRAAIGVRTLVDL
jgi:hypothetical protein